MERRHCQAGSNQKPCLASSPSLGKSPGSALLKKNAENQRESKGWLNAGIFIFFKIFFFPALHRGTGFWQEERVPGRLLAKQPSPAEISRAALMQSQRERDENQVLHV